MRSQQILRARLRRCAHAYGTDANREPRTGRLFALANTLVQPRDGARNGTQIGRLTAHRTEHGARLTGRRIAKRQQAGVRALEHNGYDFGECRGADVRLRVVTGEETIEGEHFRSGHHGTAFLGDGRRYR